MAEHENNSDFLAILRDRTMRAIMREEDRKVMEWVNSQPVVDAAAPAVTFAPNPARRNAGAQLAIIGQHIVSMGEGHADIDMEKCPVHGEQPHIGGYNQGGWDNMAVCLKCCAEIYTAWLARDVTPEQKAEDGRPQ